MSRNGEKYVTNTHHTRSTDAVRQYGVRSALTMTGKTVWKVEATMHTRITNYLPMTVAALHSQGPVLIVLSGLDHDA